MAEIDMSNYSFDETINMLSQGREPTTKIKNTLTAIGKLTLGDGDLTIYPDPTKSENIKISVVPAKNGSYTITYKNSNRTYEGSSQFYYMEWYSDNNNIWLSVHLTLKNTDLPIKTTIFEGEFKGIIVKHWEFPIKHWAYDNNGNMKLYDVYKIGMKDYPFSESFTLANHNKATALFTWDESIKKPICKLEETDDSGNQSYRYINGFIKARTRDKIYAPFTMLFNGNTPNATEKSSNVKGKLATYDSNDIINNLGDDNNQGDDGAESPPPEFKSDEIISWVAENISNPQYAEECEYFNELYSSDYKLSWSTKSFRSIIGMPFHFMEQVDPRVGASPLGKQYIEDIVYDMPIVCLRPGGPVMNSAISGVSSKFGLVGVVKQILNYKAAFFNSHANDFAKLKVDEDDEETTNTDGLDISDGLKTILLNLFVGKYARFYTFGSDMYKYIEYVNTLCHLFISFLDIGDMLYTPGSSYGSGPQPRKYAYYNDTWETCEDDAGDSIKLLNGPNKAIFGYFQPESQLNQVYTNSTRQSELASSLSQGSSIAKEYHFLMGSAGINLLNSGNNIFENLGQSVASLNGGLVGKLMGNMAEGVTSVICGNNLDLPEIWEDSQGGTEHTLVFKLVSPYGDRESIFLYVLRPLARLMAMSLPRQFGPNSYTSPFLVQAFSKGQFNVQCGIVTSLSIKRCGNGGESHTVSYIPTELEVTMTIQDMYDMVTLSNEYMGSTDSNTLPGVIQNVINASNPFGAARAARLLFNNIGLIDFCAAFCGFNLNTPEVDTMWTLVLDIWKNRVSDVIENPLTTGVNEFKSPKWARSLTDSFYSAVQRNVGFVSG